MLFCYVLGYINEARLAPRMFAVLVLLRARRFGLRIREIEQNRRAGGRVRRAACVTVTFHASCARI